MSMLPYRTALVGGFRARHLQLGVGGVKGHIIARDVRHRRLVQNTRKYNPLVTLVTPIARPLVPKWLKRTTMQLSCNVLTKPHRHLHDSSPWAATFSTGQHTWGHIWVEAGCPWSGQGGQRCRMQCLDGAVAPVQKGHSSTNGIARTNEH